MSRKSSILDRFNIVKQIPVFQNLNWFDQQRIARKSKIVEYKKGQLICRQDEPADAFFCLISGRVQGYAISPVAKKYDVEFIRRGMYFGVVSALGSGDHVLTFEAMNDSYVLKIEKDDFQRIIKRVPQLGIELGQGLSKRFHRRSVSEKIEAGSTIISVYSTVKGAGTSTYAFNLALSLKRETKKRTILLNINSILDQKPEESGALDAATPLWKTPPARLEEIIADPEKISSRIIRGQMEMDLLNVIFSPENGSLVGQISHFVTALVYDYDFVVIDLPNKMCGLVLKTLSQSDVIQLVTLDGKEALLETRQVVYKVEEELKENFSPEKVNVIISGRLANCYLSFEEINKLIDYDVFMKLPHIAQADLRNKIDGPALTMMTPAAESEYGKTVRSMARRIGNVLIGLVLGGGAALGIAHIGVIRVLEEENIPVDFVVGSSMGALIGSLWVTGRNAKQIEELAREFERPKDALKLLDPFFSHRGLISGCNIQKWVRAKLGDKTFYSTRIPFKVVAYDLIKREEMIIESGLLAEAVRRSISIPGVVQPVLEQDKMIIDGGVLNPLPTNVCIKMGIKKVIAVNVLQSPEDVTNGFLIEQNRLKQEAQIPFLKAPFHYVKFRAGQAVAGFLGKNIGDVIVRSLQASEYIIAEQSARHASVVIHPDLAEVNWFELYKVDQLIQAGEAAARRHLRQINALTEI